MANDGEEVKGSKGTNVAIVVALIGVAGTLGAALIGKIGASPAPQPAAAGSGTLAPAAAPASFAGDWVSARGQKLQMVQNGAVLSINSEYVVGDHVMSGQGTGQIDGDKVKWVVEYRMEGIETESECFGQLTSDQKTLQASCTLKGIDEMRAPTIYTRL